MTVDQVRVGKGRPSARRPDLDTLYSVNPDGTHNRIHPADVRGRFQRRKHVLWVGLIALYLLLPWVEIGGKPAVLIDIARRHFYLFGSTFNAQDFWLAFFYLTGLGFGLFVVAALFGRVWCGYACPQTVFLEGVFRRIERLIDGSPQSRVRLQQAPWSAAKVARRLLKHAVYLAVALVLSHAFLGYFMPVREVLRAMTSPPGEHLTAFLFVVAATATIYGNFAWFREQLCIVICPYGRLQGTLYDPDTVVVGYDRARGEPRGPVSAAGAGDCVDCFRCVAVCPTGIDIRNGTQMECVGCANCIDACDEVMTRVGRRTGLVRYDSQNGFSGGKRRFWRPRVGVYAVLLAAGMGAFLFAASRRTPFEANLTRAPGMSVGVEDGKVRNHYLLHLVNKLPETATFRIEAIGPPGAEAVIAQREVELASLADTRIVVQVVFGRDQLRQGLQAEFAVTATPATGAPVRRTAKASLVGPPGSRR